MSLSANHKPKRIAAIILAAGKGQRIGQPKWQLCYQGKTFLEIILANLQKNHCAAISCVTAPSTADAVAAEANTRCTIVVNPKPELGMLSSVYYGLQSLPPDYDGYLIFPVDHPFVQSKTIELLMQHFTENYAADIVVVPKDQEHFGHPIIVAKSIAQTLTPSFFHLSFKDFLQQQNYQRHAVIVDDAGILKNVNSWQDLQ